MGLEPIRPIWAQDFKSCLATDFNTRAILKKFAGKAFGEQLALFTANVGPWTTLTKPTPTIFSLTGLNADAVGLLRMDLA